MSDNAWPFPTARAAGRFRRCTARGRTWPGRKWLRLKHKVSWDRVVEHGRDLRCCIAPRRVRSDGRHDSPVASCLRFRRFRQPRLARRHRGWKHLRVPEDNEAWESRCCRRRRALLPSQPGSYSSCGPEKLLPGLHIQLLNICHAICVLQPAILRVFGLDGRRSVDWHRRRCA